MPCKSLPSNGFLLPSNEGIAAALIERFRNFITGISYKTGVRYHLSQEDREDLTQHLLFKLAKADWRAIFRRNKLWIKSNTNHRSRLWTVEETVFVLKNYAKQVLLTAIVESVWVARSSGLTGLGIYKVKPSDLPRPYALVSGPQDETGENQFSSPDVLDPDDVSFGRDGQPDRTAAKQIAAIAQELLEPQEWQCLYLQFGFDGGGIRTPTQVAREAKLPRKQTQELLDTAMSKLRERIQ